MNNGFIHEGISRGFIQAAIWKELIG